MFRIASSPHGTGSMKSWYMTATKSAPLHLQEGETNLNPQGLNYVLTKRLESLYNTTVYSYSILAADDTNLPVCKFFLASTSVPATHTQYYK